MMEKKPKEEGLGFEILRAVPAASGFEIRTVKVTFVRYGAPANEPTDGRRFAVRTPEGELFELFWAHEECGGCTYAVYNWPHGALCVACWQKPAS